MTGSRSSTRSDISQQKLIAIIACLVYFIATETHARSLDKKLQTSNVQENSNSKFDQEIEKLKKTFEQPPTDVGTYQATKDVLDLVITALDRALLFFAKEYKKLNLDAVIGTRIVASQLKVLLRRLDVLHSRFSEVEPEVVEVLRDLQTAATVVSDSATPYIARTSPEYYKKIHNLLDSHLWELDYNSRDVNRSRIIEPIYVGEVMHENDSDECLEEIFGTGKTPQACQISDVCWHRMTKPGYTRFSLSHQLLFLVTGLRFGCYPQMLQKAFQYSQPDIDSLSADICANLLRDVEDFSAHGLVLEDQDIFMEDAALCGMLGYRQFFRLEWITAILSWQRKSGCFGDYREAFPTKEGKTDSEYFKRSDVNTRVKREEKFLDDGCLAHKTTVALGALVNYVRYIIEYVETVLM